MDTFKQRRSRQLMKTVEMKISVLEQQKNDIIDMIEQYIEGVRTKAHSFVLEEDAVGHKSYYSLAKQLDGTSEVLSKITDKLYQQFVEEQPFVEEEPAAAEEPFVEEQPFVEEEPAVAEEPAAEEEEGEEMDDGEEEPAAEEISSEEEWSEEDGEEYEEWPAEDEEPAAEEEGEEEEWTMMLNVETETMYILVE